MRKIGTTFEKDGVGFWIIGDNRTDKIEVHGDISGISVKHNVGMANFYKPGCPMPRPLVQKAGSEPMVGNIYPVLLKNGETVDFVVTEVTSSYIRFDSRDCIAGIKTRWNESGSNEGGYPGSTLWDVVNGKILNLFPDELLDRIITTKRYYLDGDDKKSYKSKLFVPAASEVFSKDDCLGDEGLYEQTEYYKDRRHRMKGAKKGEDTAAWWLASAYSGSAHIACTVGSDGGPGCNYVYYPFFGVPVCFRIKRQSLNH